MSQKTRQILELKSSVNAALLHLVQIKSIYYMLCSDGRQDRPTT